MTPSASTSARPPRLVLRFAVYSAIALALAWVVIFWVVRREAEDRAQHQVEIRTSEVAARVAPDLVASDFDGPVSTERRKEIDAAVAPELVGTLLRFKLVNADGVVTYSTDPEIIGGRSDSTAALESALAGEPTQQVTTLNAEGGSGENVKAVESYVPLTLDGSSDPAGVFEAYVAYEPVAADVRETVTPIAIALALALFLLYAALFPILRQVTRALDNRHRRLEEHASALTEALDERRRAEVRLTRAERNYRSLVEQLPLVMYITRLDETSSCIYMSPQIEELTGYTALECMSDPAFIGKMLHPEDRERTLEERRRAAGTGESFATKYRIVGKDKREVWVHDEVTIAKDESGRPIHAQGFVVDVTPQVTARHQLEGRHAELEALHETALALIDELDVQKLLEQIAGQAGELIGTNNSYVYLRDGDELRVAVGTGVFAGNVGHRLVKGEGLAGRVWETGEPLTVEDYQSWDGRKSRYDGMAIHGVAGVPLRSRTEVVGVLGLAYGERGRGFDASDIALLSRFAHLASLALESARLYTSAKEELAERRRAESAVREAELRYRTLVEHLPLVTYISPVEETVGNLYVSPQVEELLGYPSEEWVRNPNLLTEAVHPDDLERVLAEATHLRETGESLRSEYRYITADGRTVWVLDETILVRNDEGTPLWVQGFILDITERRTAEETRARLAAIIESSNDAIMSGSLDLCFTSWNDGAQRMFGYTADEVIGQPITLLMPDEYQEQALALVDEVVREARVVQLETVRHHEDRRARSTSRSPTRPSATRRARSSACRPSARTSPSGSAPRPPSARARPSSARSSRRPRSGCGRPTPTTSTRTRTPLSSASSASSRRSSWAATGSTSWSRRIASRWPRPSPSARAEKAGWSGLVIRWQHADGSVRHLESNATPVLDADGRGGRLAGNRPRRYPPHPGRARPRAPARRRAGGARLRRGRAARPGGPERAPP